MKFQYASYILINQVISDYDKVTEDEMWNLCSNFNTITLACAWIPETMCRRRMNVILDEDDGANDADDITDDDVSFLN